MSKNKGKKILKYKITGFFCLVIFIFILVKTGIFFQSPKIQNFILISVDDLRPDRLQCYGHTRNTSPGLDRLVQNGAQFQNAYISWPMTLRSHASMFTSLYPSVLEFPMDPKIKTIASILKEHGYNTGAFTGGGYMSYNFGLLNGFKEYDDYVKRPDVLANKTNKWLEKNQHQKFFLFLHTYYVHQPYVAPPEYFKKFADPNYSGPVENRSGKITSFIRKANAGKVKVTSEDRQRILDIYDAQIIRIDETIHQIAAHLERLKLMEKTMLIITSDHGEQFFEYNRFGHTSHGNPFADISTRVPLIIYSPVLPDQVKINQFVEAIDIPPTILDAAGLKIPDYFQGQSLYPLLCKKPRLFYKKKKEIFFRNRNFMGIRTTDAKIIVTLKTGELKLFDLINDPQEKKNVIENYSYKKTKSLLKKIDHFVKKNEELREKLKISNIKLSQEILDHPFSFDKKTLFLSSFHNRIYRYRKNNSLVTKKFQKIPFQFIDSKYKKGILLKPKQIIYFQIDSSVMGDAGAMEFSFKINKKTNQKQKIFQMNIDGEEGVITIHATVFWDRGKKITKPFSFSLFKISQGKIQIEQNFSHFLKWKNWHHLLLAWKPNEIYIFLDGHLISKKENETNIFFKQNTTKNIKLSGENFIIDELRISSSSRIIRPHSRKQHLDDKVLERLKSLGYLR